MPTTTDYIVLCILALFFIKGWHKGIVRILLAPVSFFICSVAGLIYFKTSGNFWMVFLITVVGPFFLNILLSLLLGIWNKSFNPNNAVTPVSRISGGVLSLLWGLGIVGLSLLAVLFLPFAPPFVQKIQNDIQRSRIYALVERLTPKELPSAKKVQKALQNLKDPEASPQIESLPEYQDVLQDPKIQDILSDESLGEKIKNKDFAALIGNSKILSIVQDQELLKKLFDFQKKLIENEKHRESPESSAEYRED